MITLAGQLDEMVVQRHPKKEASRSNNIRNWRIFKGIQTHQELSSLTAAVDENGKGINRVCISRLESSEMRYHEDHIELLSKALRVTPSDLIGTNPFDSGSVFAIYALASITEKRAIETFMRELRATQKAKKSNGRAK